MAIIYIKAVPWNIFYYPRELIVSGSNSLVLTPQDSLIEKCRNLAN